MRKTTLFFSHEYAALEFSLGLKLVFSEAAHCDGQWEWKNTGLPVTCNSALYGRDEHKFHLVFSSVIKSKGLHHVQEDSKCCCSFFFMPGSYFLRKTLLISMLQLSTLDRRRGRKENLLPMKVSCIWHSPITDLLRNWHNLPVDIRQLWSSPVLFSSKCVKLSPLSYSFPWLWSMEPNSHTHPAHI